VCNLNYWVEGLASRNFRWSLRHISHFIEISPYYKVVNTRSTICITHVSNFNYVKGTMAFGLQHVLLSFREAFLYSYSWETAFLYNLMVHLNNFCIQTRGWSAISCSLDAAYAQACPESQWKQMQFDCLGCPARRQPKHSFYFIQGLLEAIDSPP
jgi:hypothetical protein